MKNIKYFVILLSISFIFSCDVIEPSKDLFYVQETDENTTDSTVVYEKKSVLIEFTGHLCTNCPEAHREIAQLMNVYNDKFIAVAIHAGYLARINEQYGFTTDFRTAEGTEIFNDFGITTVPIGLVSSLDKNSTSSFSSWANSIDEDLSAEPEIGILLNADYVEDTRTVNIEANIEILQDLEAELLIWGCLVENDIISKQKDNNVVIDDYVHKHVLRKIFTDTWGDAIFSASTNTGETQKVNLSVTVNNDWNEENCAIVVFVYDNISKKIYNVEEIEIL